MPYSRTNGPAIDLLKKFMCKYGCRGNIHVTGQMLPAGGKKSKTNKSRTKKSKTNKSRTNKSKTNKSRTNKSRTKKTKNKLKIN